MPLAQDLTGWEQFGLAGMVIGALFCTLFVIVRWLINHIDEQAKKHREEREEWRKEHREERADWMETEEKAIKELTDALHDFRGNRDK